MYNMLAKTLLIRSTVGVAQHVSAYTQIAQKMGQQARISVLYAGLRIWEALLL